MKKLLFIFLIILIAPACKKTKFAPAGPTDVRVRNISDQTLTEVKVNIQGNIQNYGNIATGQVSGYLRFDTAYVKAEITAKVNNVLFSTAPFNYRGLTYIGQERITYVIWILDFNNKELEIDDVIYEEPLILK
jgi:hypothetical protein